MRRVRRALPLHAPRFRRVLLTEGGVSVVLRRQLSRRSVTQTRFGLTDSFDFTSMSRQLRHSQRLFCTSSGSGDDSSKKSTDETDSGDSQMRDTADETIDIGSDKPSQSATHSGIPTEPMILAETRNQLARVSAEKSLARSRKPWKSVVPYIGDVLVFAVQKPFFPGFSSTLQIVDEGLKRQLVDEYKAGKHWIGVFLHDPTGARGVAPVCSGADDSTQTQGEDVTMAVETDASASIAALSEKLAADESEDVESTGTKPVDSQSQSEAGSGSVEGSPVADWTELVQTNLDEINCDLLHRVPCAIDTVDEVYAIGTLVKVDWDDASSNVKQFMTATATATDSDSQPLADESSAEKKKKKKKTSSEDSDASAKSSGPLSEEPLYLKVIGARRISLNNTWRINDMPALVGSIDHLEPVISSDGEETDAKSDSVDSSDSKESSAEKDLQLRSEFNVASELLKGILRDDPDHREDLLNLWRNKHMIDIGFFADFAANLTNSTPREMQRVLECIDYESRLRELVKLLRREERMIGAREEIIRDVDALVERESTEKYLHMILHSTMRRLYQEYKTQSQGTAQGSASGSGQQHTHRRGASGAPGVGGHGHGQQQQSEGGGEESKANTRYKRLAAKFVERAEGKHMSAEAKEMFEEGIEKMTSTDQNMLNMDMENTKQLCDWLSALPWDVTSADDLDLARAIQVLDDEHFGMSAVKERILEIIAMNIIRRSASGGQSVPASKGKILCLVGPPGVGKTSIGSSIANALKRKFYKFSLGGNDDSHLLKGFLRTYVGANPGKLIYGLRQAEVSNPVMMIDEIDKMGARHSDPSHALLEILDPSQNSAFVDHYLDCPVDLSRVLFVCTANDEHKIDPVLADRLHIVRLSGYDYNEKLQIAKKYLIPKAFKSCGVPSERVVIGDEVIAELIRWYCRESGVRSLDQHLERIISKAALQLVQHGAISLPKKKSTCKKVDAKSENAEEDADSGVSVTFPTELQTESSSGSGVFSRMVTTVWSTIAGVATEDCNDSQKTEGGELPKEAIVVTCDNLKSFVGPRRFTHDRTYESVEDTPPGVITGLAYSQMGGSTIYIETAKYKTHEKGGGLKATGQLGSVMSESTEIAFVLARSMLFGIDADNDFFDEFKVHLHAPEGGVSKDGPSAGITITSALLSLAMGVSVTPDIAMTGEVTLTGKVLKIGGIREKLLAAKRAKITTLIFPFDNKEDFYDDKTVPQYLRDEFESVHFVTDYQQVFDLLFAEKLKAKAVKAKVASADGSEHMVL